MHRDLKLENLLLAAPNDISCVKIAGAFPFLLNLQTAQRLASFQVSIGEECVSSLLSTVLAARLLPITRQVLVRLDFVNLRAGCLAYARAQTLGWRRRLLGTRWRPCAGRLSMWLPRSSRCTLCKLLRSAHCRRGFMTCSMLPACCSMPGTSRQ